ncbi:MAG TPA: hypothetical protein DCQ04_04670 [Actinobacteria bacterium]|nr:hypothetical protein [Actinomycetota bacterium]
MVTLWTSAKGLFLTAVGTSPDASSRYPTGLEAVGQCRQVKRQKPTGDAIQCVRARGGKADIQEHFSTDGLADRVVPIADSRESEDRPLAAMARVAKADLQIASSLP